MGMFVVSIGVFDEIITRMVNLSLELSVVRLLRILRLARLIRVIRLMRFFRDLRVMVAGILGSLRSLVWALLLLVLVMFVFAVCVMQISAEELASLQRAQEDAVELHGVVSEATAAKLKNSYGTVASSLFTLWKCITAGVNWGDAAAPLVEVTPLLGAAFSLFIAFGVLCVLNIITGVFVDNTKNFYGRDDEQVALDEIDKNVRIVKDLKNLFESIDGENSGTLSLTEFQELMKDAKVKAILRAHFQLNVDNVSSEHLFGMFDRDGDGHLNIHDFIFAVQRFHGQASSLELAQLAMQQKRTRKMIESISHKVEQTLHSIETAGLQSSTRLSSQRRRTKPPRSTDGRAICQHGGLGS